MGEIFLLQGRLDEAEPRLREAQAAFRATGHRHLPIATRELGRLASRAGRCEEAVEIFDRVREEFAASGLLIEVRETDARRAECYVLMGAPCSALEIVDELGRYVEANGPVAELRAPRLERIKGAALLQQGRYDEAEVALEASLRAGRAEGATFDVGRTLGRLAELAELRGDMTRAAAFREESELILEGLGVVAISAVPLPA
jgi:tetratricopeptide (TPR) repeat protein